MNPKPTFRVIIKDAPGQEVDMSGPYFSRYSMILLGDVTTLNDDQNAYFWVEMNKMQKRREPEK